MKKYLSIVLSLLIIVLMLCSCGKTTPQEKAKSDVLSLCNEQRKLANLSELSLDDKLCEYASIRAEECLGIKKLSHERPDGSGCFTGLYTDYIYAGENLGYSKLDAEKLIKAWMDSPDHRKNILDSNFKKVGIALAQDGDNYYYAMIFTD